MQNYQPCPGVDLLLVNSSHEKVQVLYNSNPYITKCQKLALGHHFIVTHDVNSIILLSNCIDIKAGLKKKRLLHNSL